MQKIGIAKFDSYCKMRQEIVITKLLQTATDIY